jgi:HlyD family secretion protein
MSILDRKFMMHTAPTPIARDHASESQGRKAVPEISPFADARGYLVFGMAIVILLVGSVGVWSATAQLSGAIVALGTVVVDSNVKKVQHPTGGVVGAIRVKEGDKVEAGELLVRLDDTVTRANLQMIEKQLDEIAVRQARLKAERDDRASLEFPPELLLKQHEPQLAEILASELALFESRRNGRNGLKAQLRERIAQLHEEAGGLEAQRVARTRELDFAREELAGLETLDNQRLISTTRITESRRGVARLEGDLSQAVASAAQARGKVSEIELQIIQLDQDLKTEVGKDLRDQQGKAAELTERRVAAKDQLSRIEIRAPQSGIVHQLTVHTVGGVVSPSEPIMMIVPDADRLVIEAKIAPQDIDQVKVGSSAQVRFTAFNQRTTPVLEAVVTRISADLMQQNLAGQTHGTVSAGDSAYYVARIEVADMSSPAKDLKLIPGMPADVHIKTGDRTALSYFVKPVADQFARAFRER